MYCLVPREKFDHPCGLLAGTLEGNVPAPWFLYDGRHRCTDCGLRVSTRIGASRTSPPLVPEALPLMFGTHHKVMMLLQSVLGALRRVGRRHRLAGAACMPPLKVLELPAACPARGGLHPPANTVALRALSPSPPSNTCWLAFLPSAGKLSEEVVARASWSSRANKQQAVAFSSPLNYLPAIGNDDLVQMTRQKSTSLLEDP